MAEWISVNDRLPTPFEMVLSYRKLLGGSDGYRAIEYVALGHGAVPMWSGDFKSFESQVTHWMPLPEPPKEGE